MRFQVERSELTDAVAWTARSLPARPPVAVLAGLLLDTTEGALTLSGFDFEVAANATVPATIAEAGRAVVSGRLLAEITRSLPPSPVDLTSDGNRVVLSCGSSRFTLPTMPVEDYPQLPDLPPTAGRVTASEFAQAVSQVVVAAGRDDTLPVLTGVRVEIDGDRLTLAATDRYRLAIRELGWRPEGSDLPAAALVPARNIAEAARALVGDDEVTIALSPAAAGGETLVGFANSTRRTTTRLLDGEYPRYRSLIPDGHVAAAVLDASALADAVKRVALVAQRTSPVRLSFEPGQLLLEAGTGEDAQASETLEVSYEGEPLTIAFNPQFLLDGLGVLDAPTARLTFTDPKRPAVMSGGDGGGYSYLLMPVRLSG
ncbi:MAG TPA: DNA polymerase III subunit beta [Mycobacteriales bacterium]